MASLLLSNNIKWRSHPLNAEPVTDRDRLAQIQAAQLSYVRYRAEKDLAGGMFKRFYGEAWTEEYIHGFLFDLEQ